MTSTVDSAAQTDEASAGGRIAVDTPMGWYQVGWADDLEPGSVKPITAFGADYILYRTEAGTVRMMAAYCGHMGAHLGYGGVVEDGCVVCPYHGWKWNESGKVVDIPYSKRVNPSRRLKTLPVRVVSGLVFAWYHPFGGEPAWPDPMPPIAEHGDPGYYPVWPHLSRVEEMNGHPQFVVENQVDAAHFVHVHKWSEYPQIDDYGADGHCFTSLTRAKLTTKRGVVTQHVEVKVWGLGIVISRHRFEFPGDKPAHEDGGPGEVTTICTTPTMPGHAQLRMTAWIPRGDGDGEVPTGRAAVMLRASHREVYERDWQIWDHLQYTDRPAYAREEARAFAEVRRWAEQYYDWPAR